MIRSAYGISYIHFNRMGGENLLAYNGPTIVTVTINQKPSQGLCARQPGSDHVLPPDAAGLSRRTWRRRRISIPRPRASTTFRATTARRTCRAGTSPCSANSATNLLLDVAYVGTHGTKLMVLGDCNQARPTRHGEEPDRDQRRPIPGFSYIEIAYNGNSSVYNALQTKLEKRYSQRPVSS